MLSNLTFLKNAISQIQNCTPEKNIISDNYLAAAKEDVTVKASGKKNDEEVQAEPTNQLYGIGDMSVNDTTNELCTVR